MTTLSTLKKTVIVSPLTRTYGTKLIQANHVKLQLEKEANLKIQLKMKHLLPHRILQLVFT